MHIIQLLRYNKEKIKEGFSHMIKIKKYLENGIKQIKQNKWIHYLLIAIIGIILSIPFLNLVQIRDSHDGSLHMLRLIGTVDTLKIGQFPPLINQNYCNGAGYSMNLFYPPLVTYLPLLIKLFTQTYMGALKIFAVIAIVLSGITMYQFVYQVTGKRAIAFFSAVFYMIAPYKLANVYKRYAIGEFVGMVFIPIVFLGLYNLFEQDRKKHYYIAIGATCLMLSHSVTTVYTAIFCILYILFHIKALKDKEILKKCIINGIFVLLISMLFWMPLLEATTSAEYTIMNDEVMRTNKEFAFANTLSYLQLVKDIGEENGTTFVLGIPTILLFFLTIVVATKVDKKYQEFYLLSVIFALISLFMVGRFFPWITMPNFLCKLQYPWRMLGFFIFFASIVCGSNLYYVIKKISKKQSIEILISLLIMVISISASMKIMSQFYTTDKQKDIEYETYIKENIKISHRQINRDYMPLRALLLQHTYVLNRKEVTYILEGKADIEEERKENLKDEISIKQARKDTILEFPYYYYPGYEITLETEGKIEKITAIESQNGYLSCKLPKEITQGTIKVEYVGTIITTISYIVSAISLIGFIIYIQYEKKKNK